MQELSFDPKAANEIVLSLAADVTGAWLTSDGSIVDKLQDFHVLGPHFLEKYMPHHHTGTSACISQSALLSLCTYFLVYIVVLRKWYCRCCSCAERVGCTGCQQPTWLYFQADQGAYVLA